MCMFINFSTAVSTVEPLYWLKDDEESGVCVCGTYSDKTDLYFFLLFQFSVGILFFLHNLYDSVTQIEPKCYVAVLATSS